MQTAHLSTGDEGHVRVPARILLLAVAIIIIIFTSAGPDQLSQVCQLSEGQHRRHFHSLAI